MTAMTDYFEDLVSSYFEGTTLTPSSDFYLALYTSATTDGGGGTEVTGGSYIAQIITFTAGSNDAIVLFLDLPACTVTHAAILDADTGGNMLLHGPLATPKTIVAGNALAFVIGSVDLVFA